MQLWKVHRRRGAFESRTLSPLLRWRVDRRWALKWKAASVCLRLLCGRTVRTPRPRTCALGVSAGSARSRQL